MHSKVQVKMSETHAIDYIQQNDASSDMAPPFTMQENMPFHGPVGSARAPRATSPAKKQVADPTPPPVTNTMLPWMIVAAGVYVFINLGDNNNLMKTFGAFTTLYGTSMAMKQNN